MYFLSHFDASATLSDFAMCRMSLGYVSRDKDGFLLLKKLNIVDSFALQVKFFKKNGVIFALCLSSFM